MRMRVLWFCVALSQVVTAAAPTGKIQRGLELANASSPAVKHLGWLLVTEGAERGESLTPELRATLETRALAENSHDSLSALFSYYRADHDALAAMLKKGPGLGGYVAVLARATFNIRRTGVPRVTIGWKWDAPAEVPGDPSRAGFGRFFPPHLEIDPVAPIHHLQALTGLWRQFLPLQKKATPKGHERVDYANMMRIFFKDCAEQRPSTALAQLVADVCALWPRFIGEDLPSRFTVPYKSPAPFDSGDSLYWPQGEGVCTGSWEYRRYNECSNERHGAAAYKEKVNPKCGAAEWEYYNSSPAEYKSCRHQSHGVESVRPRPDLKKDRVAGLSLQQMHPFVRMPDAEALCRRDCDAWARSLRVASPIKLDRTKSRLAVSFLSSLCYCTANFAEKTYRERASEACGVKRYNQARKIKAYAKCRLPENGIESYRKLRSEACGDGPVSYSAAGASRLSISAPNALVSPQLTRALLQAEKDAGIHDVACTTCDELPVRNVEEAAKKLSCLSMRLSTWKADRLSLPNASATVLANTALRLAARKRVLLTDAQIEEILSVVSSYPSLISPSILVSELPAETEAERKLKIRFLLAFANAAPAMAKEVMAELVRITAKSPETLSLENLKAIVEKLDPNDAPTLLSYCKDPRVLNDRRLFSNCLRTLRLGETVLKSTSDRSSAASLILSLLKTGTEEVSTDPIQATLESIGAWYRLAGEQRSGTELDELLARFWKMVVQSAKADDVFSRGELDLGSEKIDSLFARERRLAKSLVAVTPPLPPILFLHVLGSILTPLHERAKAVTTIHDLACRIEKCEEASSRARKPTALSQTMRLLARLPVREAFLWEYRRADLMDPSVKDIFQPLADHFDLVEQSLKAAHESNPRGSFDLYPPLIQPFFAITGEASKKTSALLSTGYYAGTAGKELRFSLEKERLDAIRAIGEKFRQGSQASLNQFRENRLQLALAMIGESDNAQALNRVKQQYALQERRLRDMLHDLEGLRAGLKVKTRRFAEYWKKLHDVLPIIEERQDAVSHFVAKKIDTLSVSGADARFIPGALPVSIDAIAIGNSGPWRIVKQGQEIHFSVSQTWSPTCAVQKYFAGRLAAGEQELSNDSEAKAMENASAAARLLAYAPREFRDQPAGAVDTDSAALRGTAKAELLKRLQDLKEKASLFTRAQVGPEGFQASYSTSSSSQLSAEISSRVLDSRRSDLSLPDEDADNVTHYQARAVSEEGGLIKSGARSESLSTVLSGGLSLPGLTPFAHPAGSLVLVVMPHGEKDLSKRIATHVISSQGVYPMRYPNEGETLDLYLVVNDCRANENGPDLRSLSVQANEVTAISRNATKLGDAILEALAVVDARANELLARGELLDGEALHGLRASVELSLSGARMDDLNHVPQLRQMFNDWLAQELEQLTLAAQIQHLNRQIEYQLASLRELANEITSQGKQHRVRELTRLWSLENLDLAELSGNLERTMHYYMTAYLPVVQFHLGAAYSELSEKPEIMSVVARLLAIDTLTPMTEAEKRVLGALKTLDEEQLLRESSLKGWRKISDPVYLGFPRPSCPAPGEKSYFVWNHCVQNDRSGGPRSLDYPHADFVTANSLWQAMRQGASVDIRVSPKNLYADTFRGSLSEDLVSPVISGAGIYVLLDPELTQLQRKRGKIRVEVGPDLQFPIEKTIETYRLADLGWGVGRLPVSFAVGGEPSGLELDTVGAARGLSPFTNFHFDFQAMSKSLDNAKLNGDWTKLIREVRLVFSLHARKAERKASWGTAP